MFENNIIFILITLVFIIFSVFSITDKKQIINWSAAIQENKIILDTSL